MGFALAGVCEARATDHARELKEWLADGRHGSMAWLAARLDERLDPARMLAGARSFILVADRYDAGRSPTVAGGSGRLGRIARYARGDDYHTVIKKRLHALADGLRAAHPAERFRSFVDTAPVLEREHAARAGLGWIGKHTLLIHPEVGSYVLLGGVLTTMALTPPPEQAPVPDHCGTCTRCIDACPTGAITPYSVDATRCVSYLTIERRGPVEPELFEGIGDWLFGCDVCQEVCPHNRARPGAGDGAGAHAPYTPRREGFDVLDVLGWREDDRRAAFARSALKRARLDMMKRNALIVAGNTLARRADAALRSRVESVAQDLDESELVRSTARAVLARLGA